MAENRIADEKSWQVTRSDRVKAPIAGQPETINMVQMVSGPRRRLVWSFYIVDGEITTGLFEAKLLQARAVLLRRSPIAAFVAASASSTKDLRIKLSINCSDFSRRHSLRSDF